MAGSRVITCSAMFTSLFSVILMDLMMPKLTMSRLNPAAEGLLGRKAGELIGKPIEEGLPVVSYHSGERNELVFTMALESRSEGIATVLDRNRCEIRIGIDTSPISDRETGSTSGIVLLLHQLEISG